MPQFNSDPELSHKEVSEVFFDTRKTEPARVHLLFDHIWENEIGGLPIGKLNEIKYKFYKDLLTNEMTRPSVHITGSKGQI